MPLVFKTITDRVSIVASKIGRSDKTTEIRTWLGDSYLELGMNYPFEELLATKEVSTVIGTDTYNYPTDVRAIRNLSLIDSSDFKTQLHRRNTKFFDLYDPVTQGRPTVYTSFTSRSSAVPPVIERIIMLRAVPDAVYTIQWRVWMEPVLDTVIQNTILYMPEDWLEILDWAAAMRGFQDLHEPERAAGIFAMLFGVDNPRTGKREPGLIARRMTAMEVEYHDDYYGFRPVVKRFTTRVR